MKKQKNDSFNIDEVLAEVYELTQLGYIDLVPQIIPTIAEEFDKKQYIQNNAIDLLLQDELNQGSHWISNFIKMWVYLNTDKAFYTYFNDEDYYYFYNKKLNEMCEIKDEIPNPHHNYFLAIYYFNKEEYFKSAELFQLSENQFTGEISPAFYCDWGRTLFYTKEIKQGMEKFNLATNISPNKWWICNNWSECLNKFNYNRESGEKDQLTLKLNPSDADIYANIAFRFVCNNIDFNESLHNIVIKLIENDLGYVGFYKRLAKRLIDVKEYEKSIIIIKKALMNNYNDFELHSYYAQSLFHLRNMDNARYEFELAFIMDTKNELEEVHFNLWKGIPLSSKTGIEYDTKIPEYKSVDIFQPELPYKQNQLIKAQNLIDNNKNEEAINLLFKLYNKSDKICKINKREILRKIANIYGIIGENEKRKYLIKFDYENILGFFSQGLNLSNDDRNKNIIINIINRTKIELPILGKLYSISPPKEPEKTLLIKKNLTLLPAQKVYKKHENKLIWIDSFGEEYKKENIGNDPFDFLYYLSWLSENGEIRGMKVGSSMPKDDKKAILDNFINRNRFMFKWTGEEGKESQIAQMARKKSIINNYFKFELILKKGIYYRINPEIIVELSPYPTE